MSRPNARKPKGVSDIWKHWIFTTWVDGRGPITAFDDQGHVAFVEGYYDETLKKP